MPDWVSSTSGSPPGFASAVCTTQALRAIAITPAADENRGPRPYPTSLQFFMSPSVIV
jgi:hypothetical protein